MNKIEYIAKFWKARNMVMKVSLRQAPTVFMIHIGLVEHTSSKIMLFFVCFCKDIQKVVFGKFIKLFGAGLQVLVFDTS